jgi:signal transduction histidine kinase
MVERNRLLRYAGSAIVAAAGARAAYSAFFEGGQFALPRGHAVGWAVAYVVFLLAYSLAPVNALTRPSRKQTIFLALQSVSALILVLLYPNFIIVCLLVVVGWEIALVCGLRVALAVTVVQSTIVALAKCVGENAEMTWIVFVTSFGFQLFAICTAQLLRSEVAAHDALREAQQLLSETAASQERVRIARELHDILGHNLTTLTMQLDVAHRLSQEPAATHIETARSISASLLDQVREVVAQFRDRPVDVRAAILRLSQHTGSLRVKLRLPEELREITHTQGTALVRCIQEIITNALRHARARELMIDVLEDGDELIVSASDDGRGGAFIEGRGLTGMRERFEALGGSVAYGGASGFNVTARMPIGRTMR